MLWQDGNHSQWDADKVELGTFKIMASGNSVDPFETTLRVADK